ncbi:hypothetical protein K0M31_017410 [Melipona bicolor]|uniref:Uncharacterized protein n=1 Tax=Melipona bicolor TaxID=60889 RepID=A0AA40KSE5_9HYME|nr:hypothetical protein K0M31_017410 [Melipona bicolor]
MSVQAEQAAAGGGPDTRHHHHGHHNHAHHHANPHAVAAPLFRAPVRLICHIDTESLSNRREVSSFVTFSHLCETLSELEFEHERFD